MKSNQYLNMTPERRAKMLVAHKISTYLCALGLFLGITGLCEEISTHYIPYIIMNTITIILFIYVIIRNIILRNLILKSK